MPVGGSHVALLSLPRVPLAATATFEQSVTAAPPPVAVKLTVPAGGADETDGAVTVAVNEPVAGSVMLAAPERAVPVGVDGKTVETEMSGELEGA